MAADGVQTQAPLPYPFIPGSAVRVRNHVNPLSALYQVPTPSPHWEQVYSRLTQPFHLDIGTGSGRFLLAMAQQDPTFNYLGVEIREALVNRANAWAQTLGLSNIHFLFANVNVSLPCLFAPSDLTRVSIQFPDPWFKTKHHKRRVVQPELVSTLAELLQPEGTVFLQSDVENVAVEMAERFLNHPAFKDPCTNTSLNFNPLGIPTMREVQCLRLGLPIYRYWLVRR